MWRHLETNNKRWKIAVHVAAGLILAAFVWAVLDLTQNAWIRAITPRPTEVLRVPYVEALALVIVGALLLTVVRSRHLSALSLAIAALALLAVIAPLGLNLPFWWPTSLPGHPLSLAAEPSTYIVVGVLISGALLKRREPEFDN